MADDDLVIDAEPGVIVCLKMGGPDEVEDYALGAKRFVLIEIESTPTDSHLNVRVGGGLPADRGGLIAMLKLLASVLEEQEGFQV